MKKLRKNFLFLCDNAFQGENKKLSIIGIFKVILVPKLPAIHLKSTLVGNFEVLDKKIKEIDIFIDLVDEKRNPVGLSMPPVKITIPKIKDKENRTINFILEIGNIKFEREGDYIFLIKANSELIGQTSFKVIKKSIKIKT